jgi:hypothetical protein
MCPRQNVVAHDISMAAVGVDNDFLSHGRSSSWPIYVARTAESDFREESGLLRAGDVGGSGSQKLLLGSLSRYAFGPGQRTVALDLATARVGAFGGRVMWMRTTAICGPTDRGGLSYYPGTDRPPDTGAADRWRYRSERAVTDNSAGSQHAAGVQPGKVSFQRTHGPAALASPNHHRFGLVRRCNDIGCKRRVSFPHQPLVAN